MKWAVLFACGFASGVAGGVLVRALEPAPAAVRVEGERTAPAAPEGPSRAELAGRISALEDSLAELSARTPPAATSPRASEGPRAGVGVGGGPAEAADPVAEPVVDAAELARRLRGRRLDDDDYGRLFGWLTLHTDRIPDVIAALEKEIELDPRNADLRVALATAHVADLTNTAVPGPQQGIIWDRALKAYDAALGIEPEHWQARFGKAFGTSMVPEFLGQRPEAIRQFEELVEIQKRRAPAPEFAQTYFRLGTLYKDAGNTGKAREVWNAGLALFPDNEELKGALDASTKK